MKTIICFLIVIVQFITVYAQGKNLFKIQSILSENGLLNKDAQTSDLYPAALLSTDFTIGIDDDIYLADPYSARILKLNLKGTILKEFEIPDIYNKYKGKVGIKIAADSFGNIYVLLINEFFVGIIKYDNNNSLVENYALDVSPSGYVQNIKINNDNEICIWTFPPAINPLDFEKGHIYIYNLDGKFVRRTNHPFTTKDYSVSASYEESNFFLTVLSKGSDISKMNKYLIGHIEKYKDHILIDCDENNNVYLFVDNRIIIYNLENHLQKNIMIEVKGRLYNNVVSSVENIKISKTGDIYYLGITNLNNNIKQHSQYNQKDLYYTIVKLN